MPRGSLPQSLGKNQVGPQRVGKIGPSLWQNRGQRVQSRHEYWRANERLSVPPSINHGSGRSQEAATNNFEADSNRHEKPLNELKRKVTMNSVYEGSAVEKAKGKTLVNQLAVFTNGGKHGYLVTPRVR